MKKILICLLILSLIYSCQNSNESKNFNNDSIPKTSLDEKGCIIANESHIFKEEYFPFNFKNYNTESIKSFFIQPVKVDSVEIKEDETIARIYTFSNNLSNISFFVRINDSEPYYYIEGALIKDNFLKTKSRVKIDMTRSEFFKAINKELINCDTITIEEGEAMVIDYYFIFVKDKLKSIEVQTEI